MYDIVYKAFTKRFEAPHMNIICKGKWPNLECLALRILSDVQLKQILGKA